MDFNSLINKVIGNEDNMNDEEIRAVLDRICGRYYA